DAGEPRELKVKLGPHDHRVIDRLRNFTERLLQRHVISTLGPGIVLVDGALTLRTFDTPGPYLRKLGSMAEDNGVSLGAVAKKTGLSIKGIDITMLLEGDVRPARRKITRAIKDEIGHDRFLGDLYVARFGPGGDSYRVDVAPAAGLRSAHVLDEVHAGCR